MPAWHYIIPRAGLLLLLLLSLLSLLSLCLRGVPHPLKVSTAGQAWPGLVLGLAWPGREGKGRDKELPDPTPPRRDRQMGKFHRKKGRASFRFSILPCPSAAKKKKKKKITFHLLAQKH